MVNNSARQTFRFLIALLHCGKRFDWQVIQCSRPEECAVARTRNAVLNQQFYEPFALTALSPLSATKTPRRTADASVPQSIKSMTIHVSLRTTHMILRAIQ